MDGTSFILHPTQRRFFIVYPTCWGCYPYARKLAVIRAWRTQPCSNCDRPTFYQDYVWRRYVFCSDRCRATVQAALENPTSTCESCHLTFTPKRADARFCSGACRQFAYRQRKAGA